MRTRFLVLWTAAVLATATALIVHVALRFETIDLGYEVGEARRVQRRLTEAKRLLAIEAATLRQPARVEAVARGVLRMDVADSSRTLSRTKVARRTTSGRVQ